MEGEFVYRKRVADELLELQLEAAGYVLVEGAKWCGKTTTALQQAHSVIFLDDPANQQLYNQMAEMQTQKLLEGDTPRLLDEWQKYPQLWDACRL